jgi:mono/diheme cytochrome c family protein
MNQLAAVFCPVQRVIATRQHSVKHSLWHPLFARNLVGYTQTLFLETSLNQIGESMNLKGSTAVVVAFALLGLSCASETTNRNAETPQQPAAASPTAMVDELAVANEQFQKHCVGCHGEKGEGGTKTVEGRKLEVPSLREGHAVEHSDQELVKQVLDGGEGMPAFKDKVSTKEAADLIKYVRREFQQVP